MSKYSDLVSSFFEDYEQPTVQEYIVGFSGLDPDRKIKPAEIDHEQLYGLLGGEVAGHFHITREQLQKLKAYEGQISSLQSSLSAAIKTAENAIAEAERVLGARITSTETTQATLTQNQNTLASTVSGLQGTARDLSERMTGAENAQAALTASQRTLTQATEYIDAEEKKLAQRMTAAEGVQSTLQAGQSSLSGRIDTLNATANTIAGRVSKTETAQASLEGTQERFAVRLDTIQNEATTDTEILDARIDAENTPHITLGEYIRSLHRLALYEADRARRGERDTAEYAREMVDDVAGMALETRSALHDVKEDLSGVSESVEDLTDRAYALEYELVDEIRTRENVDALLSERINTAQSDLASEISQRKIKDSEIQADLNRANLSIAETITQLAGEVAARKAHDEQISGLLEGEISDRTQTDIAAHEALHAIFDYAREQSDITAGAVLDEVLRRKQGETETAATLQHEATLRAEADNEIRQGLSNETATREAEISATREILNGSNEYLRGGLDEITCALLEHEQRQKQTFSRLEDERAHEASRNETEHERLSEETAANAEGVLRLAGIFRDNAAKRRADYDHDTAQQATRNDEIRNDISDLASGLFSVAGESRRSNEYIRNALEHERITRSAEISRLQEQTDDNALAELRIMLDRLRAKAVIMGAIEATKKQVDLNAAKHDEASADLAGAVIQNTRLIRDVAEKYRTSKAADMAHIEGLYLSGAAHLREQLDTLAGVCLSMMAGTYSRLRDMEKTIARINAEIASGLEGSADDEEIHEMIDDIFAGNMSVNTSGDEDFDNMIDDIFNNSDVNP